jgi:hypothetical protein
VVFPPSIFGVQFSKCSFFGNRGKGTINGNPADAGAKLTLFGS